MEFEKKDNTCRSCGKNTDILVGGLCVECFEIQEEQKTKDPLDKFEFESDEFEHIQDKYIKKDAEKKLHDDMIVHGRITNPTLDKERAIEKILKVTKHKKK